MLSRKPFTVEVRPFRSTKTSLPPLTVTSLTSGGPLTRQLLDATSKSEHLVVDAAESLLGEEVHHQLIEVVWTLERHHV